MQTTCVSLVILAVYTSLGHTLSIGQDMTRQWRRSRCHQGFFQCNNGECISQYDVCDGKTDCSDKSDESHALCSTAIFNCPMFSFRCAYGACVNRNSRCDGKRDCADNSDELLPECKNRICNSEQFHCTSGECIDSFSVCDGTKDCQDGSDETISECVSFRCPMLSFRCAYGACIEKSKLCNGVRDCHDASDETYELCKTSIPEPEYHSVTSRPSIRDSDICMLPDKPEGGKFAVKTCRAVDVPHNPECRSAPTGPYTMLSYFCNSGYMLNGLTNVLCNNGHWDEFPVCQRLCEPISVQNLSTECYYDNVEVPCDRPLKPSTIVIADCLRSYTPVVGSGSKSATCEPDGELSERLIQCVEGASRSTAPNATVIINIFNIYIGGGGGGNGSSSNKEDDVTSYDVK